MTSDEDVSAFAAEPLGTLGETINILVHVTGGLVARKTIAEMDIDRWNRVMDLDATSFVCAIKAVLPHIKNGGSIVGLASQAGRAGCGRLRRLERRGDDDDPRTGQRAGTGHPRQLRLPWNDRHRLQQHLHQGRGAQPRCEHHAAETRGHFPGRGEPGCYMASDEAALITGANIDINGGLLFS